MGAHPFRIQMAYQNTSGQVFPHGVTNNAVSAGTLRFEVPLDAPNTLYYQCTSHAGTVSYTHLTLPTTPYV